MTQMRDDSQSQNQFGVSYKPQSEKSCSAHAPFRVVKKSVDTSVCKLRRDLLDEEEIGVEPAKVAQDFITRCGSPDMKGYQRLCRSSSQRTESTDEEMDSRNPGCGGVWFR